MIGKLWVINISLTKLVKVALKRKCIFKPAYDNASLFAQGKKIIDYFLRLMVAIERTVHNNIIKRFSQKWIR